MQASPFFTVINVAAFAASFASPIAIAVSVAVQVGVKVAKEVAVRRQWALSPGCLNHIVSDEF